MKSLDSVITAVCLNVFCLLMIDLFDSHSFGIEAFCTVLSAILLIWMIEKDKDK
jgi:hypothetical protein